MPSEAARRAMLNKAPIFINGFSFGGTNLIMNLLASHRDVCLLSGETHEVFQGGPHRVVDKLIRRFHQDMFGKECLDVRGKVPKLLMKYIDLTFYIDKLTTDRNTFKCDGIRYSLKDIRNARVLAKNVNGTVLASGIFADMYPDAIFISLLRNGIALCEGYLRRGWSAEECGRMYERVCRQIITDSDGIPNYHIVRFEEMVSDPVKFMKKIYAYAGLDEGVVEKVRLQAKLSMENEGTRSYTFGRGKDRETYWFRPDELAKYVRSDVNDNQARQISRHDQDAFLKEARKAMEYYEYL